MPSQKCLNRLPFISDALAGEAPESREHGLRYVGKVALELLFLGDGARADGDRCKARDDVKNGEEQGESQRQCPDASTVHPPRPLPPNS